jgi:hypothetical protein
MATNSYKSVLILDLSRVGAIHVLSLLPTVVKKKEINHDRLVAVCQSNPKKEETVNKFVSFLEDGGCLKKSRKFHIIYVALK